MRMAGDAADLLLGNRPGLLLIGPERQTQAVVRLVLDRLSSWPIIPILFAASGASRVALRDAVGQAHATRSDPKASLLLVIEEADLLSPALLSELEQAAGAAAEYGGLQFLLAGQQDLAPTLQRDGRAALSKCLRTRLSVRAPVLPVDPRGAAASVIGPPRRDPVVATRPRPELRIMRAGAVVTGCVVIAGLVAAAYLHEHPARLMPPEMLSVPRALVRSQDHPPAQMAQRTEPPLPSPDGSASLPQPPRTIPVIPEPSSPQRATPAPAPPVAELAQTDTPPPPSPSQPAAQLQPDDAAQPVSPEVPMPEQPAAAPALPVASAAPPSAPITQPDRPTQDSQAAIPASPVVTPEQPDQPAGPTAPAVSPPAPVATVVPPAASPGQAVTVLNPSLPPTDRQQQAAPTASTSSKVLVPQSPDAVVIEDLPARQPPSPSPAASPAASDRPQQAPATPPSQPVATQTISAGDTPHDPPVQPVPPAAAPIQIQQLPPLRQAGSADGPPPLTGPSALQPQGLPAPQRQALLLPPMPVQRNLPPSPRAPQTVPRTPAGASLLLLAGPNDTLRSLYREVYRGVRPPRFETVAALNPAAPRPGMRLIFPAPPDGWPAPRRSRR